MGFQIYDTRILARRLDLLLLQESSASHIYNLLSKLKANNNLQYTLFSGTTPLTPPLGFSTSPLYLGIK